MGSHHGPVQAGASPGVDPGTQPPSTFLPPPCLPVGFPGGPGIKNPPGKQERQVQSLDWEEPRRRKWQPAPVFLPGEFHG